jgi:methyl-accepting chemotaxis protein
MTAPSAPSAASPAKRSGTTRSLQRSFILLVGGAATLALAAVTWTQLTVLAQAAERGAEARLTDLGQRSARLVNTEIRNAGAPPTGDTTDVTTTMIESALASATAGTGSHVALVDSGATPRVLASSDTLLRAGRPFPAATALKAGDQTGEADFDLGGERQHAMITSLREGRFRLVSYTSNTEVMAPYTLVRWGLLGGAFLLFGGLVTALVAGNWFISRRITRPADRLARAAEKIASGDLTVEVPSSGAGDEVDRLAAAIGLMVDDLRSLATALSASARETNALSGEISAGAEEMAAAAGQIATTASDLSRQSTTMAESITGLAASAEQLMPLAESMDEGAREGVERNERLRALALENRARLDESNTALEALATDVEENARAAESLATASEEVTSFVTQIRKLARQSKLLALNAAMEAARAGEHGQGFAVVAEEVRRLAGMSTDAAERTQAVVQGVLGAITQSRDASVRAVGTVKDVRAATAHASRSFEQIESAVETLEAWTASVEATSGATGTLVREMRERLEALTQGTESFAAAMEEVAASSQEQSASTEEIAGAAATLSAAAERLQRLVANLRVDDAAPAVEPPPSAPPAAAPATNGPVRSDYIYGLMPERTTA